MEIKDVIELMNYSRKCERETIEESQEIYEVLCRILEELVKLNRQEIHLPEATDDLPF